MECIEMAKYFEVITDNGHIQIDDTYKNLVSVYERPKRITVQEHTIVQNEYMTKKETCALISIDKDTILTAVKPLKLGVPFIVSQINRKVRIYPDIWKNKECEFYVYEYGAEAERPTGNFGLNIFNAEGKVIYASAWRYLNIVCCFSGTFQLKRNVSNEKCLSTSAFTPIFHKKKGHEYAVLQGNYPYFFYDYNPQGHHAGALGIMETEEEIGLMPMDLGRTGYTSINHPRWLNPDDDIWRYVNYTIVDVTEYDLASYAPKIEPKPKPPKPPRPPKPPTPNPPELKFIDNKNPIIIKGNKAKIELGEFTVLNYDKETNTYEIRTSKTPRIFSVVGAKRIKIKVGKYEKTKEIPYSENGEFVISAYSDMGGGLPQIYVNVNGDELPFLRGKGGEYFKEINSNFKDEYFKTGMICYEPMEIEILTD